MIENTSSNDPYSLESVENLIQTIEADGQPLMLTTKMYETCQNMIFEQATAMQDQNGGDSTDEAFQNIHERLDDLYELTEAVFEHICVEETDEDVMAQSFATFYASEQEKRLNFLNSLHSSDEYMLYNIDGLRSMSLEAAHLYHNPQADKTYADVLKPIYEKDVTENFGIFYEQLQIGINGSVNDIDPAIERREKFTNGAKLLAKEMAKAAITGIAIGLTLRARKK